MNIINLTHNDSRIIDARGEAARALANVAILRKQADILKEARKIIENRSAHNKLTMTFLAKLDFMIKELVEHADSSEKYAADKEKLAKSYEERL